jgi:hypothetical protein
MAQGQPAPRRWADGWVRRGRRFIHALRRPQEGNGPRRPRAVQAIEQAYQLYSGPGSFQRGEVEARLLAGETFEEVAARCDSRVEAVEAYHALFFEVQGVLKAADYIANVVIGRRLHCGLTEEDVDLLLKCFAYCGGPLVLDGALLFFRRPLTLPGRLEALSPTETAELRSRLRVRASVLALTLSGDATGWRKLAAVRDLLEALGGNEEGSGAQAMRTPAQAALDHVWTAADRERRESTAAPAAG